MTILVKCPLFKNPAQGLLVSDSQKTSGKQSSILRSMDSELGGLSLNPGSSPLELSGLGICYFNPPWLSQVKGAKKVGPDWNIQISIIVKDTDRLSLWLTGNYSKPVLSVETSLLVC